MAKKSKITILTTPPKPSRRIVGGSSQRSPLQQQLQGSQGWKYNHAPVNGSQKENYVWWKQSANFTAPPLSASSNLNNLYTNQAVRGQVQRTLDSKRISNFSADIEKTIKGGSNQPFNKKHRLANISFGPPEQEIDIGDEIYPHTKKRVTLRAALDGNTFVGEQVLPFSAFSSSIVSGYQASLSASGYNDVDFANLHNDKIQPYGGEIPAQGPFTERFVGGIQARHNAPLMTTGRKEQFSLSLDGGFAIATITISIGGGSFATSNYNGKEVTLSLGGVSFVTAMDNTADMDESTESVTGVQDAASVTDVASSLVTSINASAAEQGLRVSAYNLGSVIIITTTIPGPSINGTSFAGSLIVSAFGSTSAFAGGKQPSAGITAISGQNPRGQYLRDQAAKAPVNIKNIQTLFTSNSVRVVGNFIKNYEVVQGSNRAATNMDLAFNTENYNFSAPSAFVTTPSRRALGLTGSADYPAPRQRADVRTNDTIFVNRFSAPGGKTTSKQQFRDVASDQFSPNNVLPYRNLLVRLPYSKKLGTHVAFGGMVPGSPNEASVYKTQRNETQRIEITGVLPNTHVTGNFFDTYYFTRPIPAGDSTQWFMALSGSDTKTYGNYVLAGSKYPESITVSRTTFDLAMGGMTGSGTFLDLDGNPQFVWSNNNSFAPWSQLRSSYLPTSRFLRNNNLFELLPEEVSGFQTLGFANNTSIRTYPDQAQTPNTISKYYSRQYREPVITSRYKPLIHHIETFIGDADNTSDNKITLNLEYSYGNSLMGFANRELNKRLQGNLKFNHNIIKRPYEVLRDEINRGPSPSLNGINMIKMFAYNETIYPREVNTYLSGTRARLSFVNNLWRDDNPEPSTIFGYPNYNALFYAPSIIKENNPQLPRIVGPFTTSQGYVVQRGEQLPFSNTNPSFPQATGYGSASIWPLDSYLYSSQAQTYATNTFKTGTFSTHIVLADQATTECGELMMTSFGTVIDHATDSDVAYNTQSFAFQQNAPNKVSAQYIYCRPFVTGNEGTTSFNVAAAFPGGPAFSRPPWTAGSERRHVDGEIKYSLNTKSFPFYNSYDEWAEELRLIGKAYSIVPEYRISEHVSTFKDNRSLFTAISSSLEITGANSNIYDGTNSSFYTRFATTDNIEFMSDFMSYDKGDVDYIFNKYPRHLELSSDALVKMLPYEGFYPVNRTLQLATLYSQSYGPNSQYSPSTITGSFGKWRSLLRPFFAPGIMYNSIKSGVAVDYPIRRAGRNRPSSLAYENSDGSAWSANLYDPIYPGYKIGHPLFGCLVGGTTSSLPVSGNLPGNTRRNPNSMDWSDPDVNDLFWADRLPFESILAPEDYLSADLTTKTGSLATILSDVNGIMKLDATGSFIPGSIDSNNLYKKAVSNFIANVPSFFLRTKNNKFGHPGKMTKFVSQFGNPSKGSQEVTSAARKVSVDAGTAYMMEIGLLKTDQFNLYSNPAAFGQATSTNSLLKPWHIVQGSGSWTPSGSSWPKHHGEYAPFAPPYYYGPSLARITFMPTGDKTEYTLDEILNNDRGEVFVDYLNESGSYYDINSGSFVTSDNVTISSNQTPEYGWNRAWLNRMDIDASINIGNEFPVGPGSAYRSSDPNKWTIMPKWETPVLDFPNVVNTPAIPAQSLAFASASATVDDFAGLTSGTSLTLTSSTTSLKFEFDNSTPVPASGASGTYTIGVLGIGSNAEAAQAISASINLAFGLGDIDVSPFVSDSLSPTVLVFDTVGGSAINGQTAFGNQGGTGVQLGFINPVTTYSGGQDARAATAASTTVDYNFSASVNTTEFSSSTQGMWHQYGTMPDAGEGVYMYIKDIPTGEHEEYDLVATFNYVGGFVGTVGAYTNVRKVPKFVIDSGREVSSLADLCGFDPDEIIRKGFDTTKAKRIGEIAMDNENSISEAIVAMPFYLDKDGEAKLITLQSSPSELGPKVKEFRKRFTKYSMPPVLAKSLLGMVPKGYPFISNTINPFGGDEYDEVLSGEDIKQIPVVYLMEHIANLTRQDLADIWQGVMPDLSQRVNFSFSSIDHYMPGDNVEEELTQFPEVLKEQLNVNAKIKDGHPRYDLLDIAEKACKQGFFPEIRWLVFKVKEKGYSTYADMIQEEVDGPNALGYDNAKQFLSLQGLPEDQIDRVLGDREEFAKNAYIKKHSLDSPTYNWPYDYCSLIESVKVATKVGFRPDLKKEYGDT